ncbi:hypothetical protein [uncultured Ramlibacter sp.]|uniref:hypothetical protein n=1 Tax=uncultured Ramlibacter sp. TaxID=260755 RepID=UPI002619C8A7|nr:hypothetical protein [uncultured Ramlibacter sp.]
MTSSPPTSPNIINCEHRDWQLQARWFQSLMGTSEGWVCFVSGPNSQHKLNIGRWPGSELAIQQGRDYVDRRLDATQLARIHPSVKPRNPNAKR